MAIWYIFTCFGILNKEKSGNPDSMSETFFAVTNLSGKISWKWASLGGPNLARAHCFFTSFEVQLELLDFPWGIFSHNSLYLCNPE
jgi:hypothetical protein